jgi:hypothetical protein
MLPARCCAQASDFRHLRSDIQRQQGRQCAQPEHPSPSQGGEHESRGQRREQIADRITALQNPAQHAAPSWRRRFDGQRRTDSPFAIDTDAEHRAQNQKYCVVRRESAQQLDHRKIDDVGHKRYSSLKAVRQQSEQQCAYRPQRECRGRRQYNRFFGYVEFVGERVVQKNNHEEVERVQRLTQKAGEQRVMRSLFLRGSVHLSRPL